MKKLMIAMGAAALCGAVFADVTSANVVGYTTVNTNGQYYSSGSMFVSVGNNAKWKLGQLQPEGTVGGTDFIQFLSPENAGVYLMATYYSVEEAGEEYAGWCNKEDEDEMLDNLELTPGTAFLCNISDHDTKYTFSGAVIEADEDGKITIDCSGQIYPFFANPLPRNITLRDVQPIGTVGGTDFIQFLSTKDAGVYLMATYYSIEEAGEEYAGWCNKEDEDEMLDDYPLLAGQAVLGNINIDGSPAVKFVFPSAL